jgi:hypothetical protein
VTGTYTFEYMKWIQVVNNRVRNAHLRRKGHYSIRTSNCSYLTFFFQASSLLVKF